MLSQAARTGGWGAHQRVSASSTKERLDECNGLILARVDSPSGGLAVSAPRARCSFLRRFLFAIVSSFTFRLGQHFRRYLSRRENTCSGIESFMDSTSTPNQARRQRWLSSVSLGR